MLPGEFVASKRLLLSQELSRRVLEDERPVWRWSAARWIFCAPRELFRGAVSKGDQAFSCQSETAAGPGEQTNRNSLLRTRPTGSVLACGGPISNG